MTIIYSFKIIVVNRLLIYVDEDGNSFENVITKIHYHYYGIDDEGLDALYNSCISLGKPKVDSCKEFIELNEEELLSWIETSITDAKLSLMQSVIAKNIEEQKTRTTLPWLA